MSIKRLEKCYIALLIIIFGGIVLHAPLSVGFGVLFPAYDLLIKSWKEVLLLLGAVLAVVIVTRLGLWRELFHDWITRIIVLYALLHAVVAIVFYQGAAATLAGLAIDLRYVLFFGLVYVGMRVVPQARKYLVMIGIAGACIVVGFATLQYFLPPDILSHIGYGKDTIVPYLTVDKNSDFVRVNSTLRGPNPLGAYAGMVLGLLAAAVVRNKVNIRDKKVLFCVVALGVCSSVALWLSYSRSALVAGVVTVSIVLLVTVMRKLSKRDWVITIAVIGALMGGLVLGRDSSFVSNVLLHENTEGGSSVSSNEEHAQSLAYGLDRLISQPLGAGVGSTGSASLYGNSSVIIENQYLFIAHEAGWLGLGLFLLLFAIILLRLWRGRNDWLSLGVFASGIGLALIGLLLPVWVDDTVSIVWWGLAALALAKGKKYAKTTK